MPSPQKLPENSIGQSIGVLKNSIGTLKGMLGTIGGELVKPAETRQFLPNALPDLTDESD